MKTRKPRSLILLCLTLAGAHNVFPAPVYINEVLFNPPASPDNPNEYIEFRGAPNDTISSNTYFVVVDGGLGDVGKVRNVFPLSGMMIGNNGFLVLLQKNPVYTNAANCIAITNTGSQFGWGDSSGSSIGHNGNDGSTNMENPSITFMLIQAPVIPTPADNIDTNNNGVLDGPGANWTILDAVGILDNTGAGERAYGKINFRRNSAAAASNTIVAVTFVPSYVGRAGNTTNWVATSWVAGDVTNGVPNWKLDPTKVTPTSYANSNLNHIGRANFGAADLAGVKLVQSGGSTDISESGTTDTYTLELNKAPTGSVTVLISADPQLEISTNGTTFASTRTVTFTAANYSARTITVRTIDDTKVETAIHPGFVSHSISATADTANFPTSSIIPTVSAKITDNDVVLLSDIKVNPPSNPDAPFEFVEIRGTANAVITNLYLVALDGSGGDKGEIDTLVTLNTNLGSNGQLIVLGSGHPYSIPGTTTVITNSQFTSTNNPEGALRNNTISILLISSPTPLTLGQDFDSTNNGNLILPAGATIMDAVGWTDGTVGDIVYGGAAITQPNWTPDAATRFAGNNTPRSAPAWFCGELFDDGGTALLYDSAKVSTNAPIGAALTPGSTNNMPPVANSPPAWSGVVGDTNPPIRFTVNDAETAASNLTVTAVSGSPSLPNSQLSISGSVGAWTLNINPTNICYDVPITITIGDGNSQTVKTVRYAASLGWRTNAHFYLGFGDSSAAIPLDDDYMLVADDETHPLKLVSRKTSGPAIKEFDFSEQIGLTNRYPESGELYEADFEAATRTGDIIYWLTSQGNGGDGRVKPNRLPLIATRLSGTGTNISLTLLGSYEFLRQDLITWDGAGLHGKGANYYGLVDSSANFHIPKTIDGFNVEALTMALGQDNTNVAFIGFRAPFVPISHRAKALVIPILNLGTLTSGFTNAGHTQFGEPIELDLGGRGVRSMERYADGYLIIAGPYGAPTGDPYEFRLFTWSGDPNQAAQEMSADLSGLIPEGVVALSSATLTSTSQVQVISDNGVTRWYVPLSNKDDKELPEPNFRKCRSDWVMVGNPVSRNLAWNGNATASSQKLIRGTGTNGSLQSYVASLDGLRGVALQATGGVSQFYPGNDWTNTLYHYNATSPPSPLAFQNPIVAFGREAGGTPVTVDRTYRFSVGFGDRPRSTAETNGAGVTITVYDRQTFQKVTNVVINLGLDPWSQAEDFLREGINADLPQYGLTTFVRPALNDAMDINGFYLSHRSTKAEYLFVVGGLGYLSNTNATLRPTLVSNGVASASSPLYVIGFDHPPVWRSDFVLQPHFGGEPLPPTYAGKTVDELLNYSAPVTNQISVPQPASSYTNLDASPELRRHPILDSFVQDMNRDPIVLANYVHNEIKLIDAFSYAGNATTEASINQGGINRGALATFQEGQGSPLEQCSLLVYLLRQAGVPAVYVFPTNNGLKMLDARLSRLLRFQVSTNSAPRLIPVNYPWVAAYNGTNWIHVFPWLKDTELVEGLDLYDYLPSEFNNGYKWAREYLALNAEIFKLGRAKDTPTELFAAHVQNTLLEKHPGITLDDIGVKVQYRKHHYSRWQDFPAPTLVSNQVFAVESLGGVTNTFPSMTNVFNTVSIEITSLTNPATQIVTPDLRVLDLHNRRFVLWYKYVNPNFQMMLSLDSFRPDATNRMTFAAANTLSPTSAQVANPLSATNTLVSSDDRLTMRFNLKRYISLSFIASTNTDGSLPRPDSARPISPLIGTTEERIVRKGDLIGICVNPGRISAKMVQAHQERYDARHAAVTNGVVFSDEDYEGERTYLLADYYFAGVSRFTPLCERLHKIQINSWFSMGLGILGAKRGTNGLLQNQAITYAKAKLDVFFQELTAAGNGTIHPERELDRTVANQSFYTLLMLNSAAQEHAALDRFFKRDTALSAVTLLQKSMYKTRMGNPFAIVELTKANYLVEGEEMYPTASGQKRLKEFDPAIWKAVTNAFTINEDSNSVRVLLTRGYVTNAVGSHFGGMLFGGKNFSALMSPVAINSDEWVAAQAFTPQWTGDSFDWQWNGWDGGFPGETFGSEINFPSLPRLPDTDAREFSSGPSASFGIQCKSGDKTMKLIMGNDCNYHNDAWFGDFIDKGDKYKDCSCYMGAFPCEMVVCCGDLTGSVGSCPDSSQPFTISPFDSRIQKYIQAYQSLVAGALAGISIDVGDGDAYSDYGYDFWMEDSEASGFGANFDFRFDPFENFLPGLDLFDDYFSDTPITTQPQLNLQIQDTGFVGSESFLDNISLNFPLVGDPVSALTGEFYINDEDIMLPGPFPLSLRRVYSSRNLADNELGYGWNMNMFPYLTVTHSGNKILTVEPNGSVISYRRDGTTTNWFPQIADNKELMNQNEPGHAVSANMLTSRLTLQTVGTNSYYRIHLPDGSTRKFLGRKFRKNNVDRDRPYLIEWADSRGNTHTFTYGEDSSANDYGKVRKIQSSSGNSIVLYYNSRGHIIEALSNDGRRVRYLYDLNTGDDLVAVVRPDGSEVGYSYERQAKPDSLSTNYIFGWSEVANNGVVDYVRGIKGIAVITNSGSTHRITAESKPEGRFLSNLYDSQGRVTQQWATVGLDLRPVKMTTMVYSNNYVVNGSNAVSGFTLIIDALGNTNRYDYTNGLITKITDPLGYSILQEWYLQTNITGGYVRSIKSRTDKRGLRQDFIYDSQGNIITNLISGGDLTGDGVTNVVFSYIYNTNGGTNILIASKDPVGRTTEQLYDATYARLPRYMIHRASSGVVIATNAFFYTNASTEFTFITNKSFGLLYQTVKAFGSADAATNLFEFDGRGLMTKGTQLTSTSDSNIVTQFYHNNRGELVDSVNAAGTTTRLTYNERGQVTAKEIFSSSQSRPLMWEYTYYNGNGEVVWNDGPRFDPEDYVWRDYDGGGRVIQLLIWRSRARADGTGVEAETGDRLYATAFNEYDLFGNLVKAVDARGNLTRMSYDKRGQIVTSVAYDSSGRVLATNKLAYEPGGEPSVLTNALGGVTRKFYTSTGQLKRQENPDGSMLQWTYYGDGRIKREHLSNSNYWETTYDDANRTVHRAFSADSQNVETKVFDRRGNLVLSTNAVGAVSTNYYDGLDRIKFAAGSPTISGLSTQQFTVYFYDHSGLTFTATNALGEKTVTTNDVLGRPVTVEIRNRFNSLIQTSSNRYATNHQSLLTISGSGSAAVTNISFSDTLGKPLLAQSFPGGGLMQFSLNTYDVAGNLISSRDELGQLTTYVYDGANRMATNVLPDGAEIVLQYNPAGSLTNRIMPGGLAWSATYDNASRILTEKETGGAQTARNLTYRYYTNGASVGLLQTVTDARGVVTSNSYDALLRLGKTDSSGPSPEHNLHLQFAYDRRGLVTQLDHYANDPLVLPPTTLIRNYDGYGQLTNEQVQVNGMIETDLAQKWDGTGRRIALSRGAAIATQGQGSGSSLAYNYRANGSMVSVVANNQTHSFVYNNGGRLTLRSNPFRTLSINQRDGCGRVKQQTISAGGSNPLIEAMNWRANSTLDDYTATRPSFTDFQDYNYNTRGQLINETLKPSLSVSTVTNTYGYDAAKVGVVISMVESGGLTNSWRSGALDFLSRVQNETNIVGAVSLRGSGLAIGAASVTATLDGNAVGVNYNPTNIFGAWSVDMQLAPGSHTLAATAHHAAGTLHLSTNSTFSVIGQNTVEDSYDPAGNVTNRVFSDGRVQSLAWDARGRLLKVIEKFGSTTNYVWTAVYDGLGRRLRTVHNPGGTNSSASLTIDSWFDPQVEFLEIAVEVNGQRTWKVYGPDISGGYGGMQGVGGLEATVRESDGATIGLLNDRSGHALGTLSGGVVTWNPTRVNGYGPLKGFVAPKLSLSISPAEAAVWRGNRLDPTGYYLLGTRYYDPAAGRFLSADPLGHNSTMDLYSAFNGDPINFFDPDGRAVIQSWQATQQNMLIKGGFWNNVGAFGISFGIVSLNAFSLGTFAKNDALVDRNLAGEISDKQLYGGMAINTGVALTSVAVGGGTGALVSKGLSSASSTLLTHVVVGGASGLTATTTDVVGTRLGYTAVGIEYQNTVSQDLTTIAIGTGFGVLMGGVTYGLQNSPLGRMGASDNTVLSGHGDIQPGSVTMPDGTYLRVFAQDGHTITDRLGNAIETGQNLSSVYQKVYGPGDVAPNYTLYSPSAGNPIRIAGNPITVNAPTSVGQLLKPNMGMVDWAACAGCLDPAFDFASYALVGWLGSGSAGVANTLSTSFDPSSYGLVGSLGASGNGGANSISLSKH